MVSVQLIRDSVKLPTLRKDELPTLNPQVALAPGAIESASVLRSCVESHCNCLHCLNSSTICCCLWLLLLAKPDPLM